MRLDDPLALWLSTTLVGAVGIHVASVALNRLRYRRLRDAYADAVDDAQRTGAAPRAVVRAHELHREFMRARFPSAFSGTAGHTWAAVLVSSVLLLGAVIVTRRLPIFLLAPVLLLVIGIRRILSTTALLAAVFVFDSLTSAPRTHVDSGANEARRDARSRSVPARAMRVP